jgi:hypothetical protein
MARITLADVEHVLEWQQIHGPSPTSDDWHQELGDMIGDLLAWTPSRPAEAVFSARCEGVLVPEPPPGPLLSTSELLAELLNLNL